MNKQQKALLRDTIVVITITAVAIVAMIFLNNRISRSKATQAMEQLGRIVIQYRAEHGSVPPEYYFDEIGEELEEHAQLGKVNYRARWIYFDSAPSEILAYTEKPHRFLLFGTEHIILRLDGRVEWIDKQKFDTTLPEQQRKMETEMLHK